MIKGMKERARNLCILLLIPVGIFGSIAAIIFKGQIAFIFLIFLSFLAVRFYHFFIGPGRFVECERSFANSLFAIEGYNKLGFEDLTHLASVTAMYTPYAWYPFFYHIILPVYGSRRHFRIDYFLTPAFFRFLMVFCFIVIFLISRAFSWGVSVKSAMYVVGSAIIFTNLFFLKFEAAVSTSVFLRDVPIYDIEREITKIAKDISLKKKTGRSKDIINELETKRAELVSLKTNILQQLRKHGITPRNYFIDPFDQDKGLIAYDPRFYTYLFRAQIFFSDVITIMGALYLLSLFFRK
jgi:hypothetical protein